MTTDPLDFATDAIFVIEEITAPVVTEVLTVNTAAELNATEPLGATWDCDQRQRLPGVYHVRPEPA